MKFEPQKVQDLISTMALELHKKKVSQLIAINFAKSLPDYRIFSAELHTERISFIIFFVLGILM